MLRQDTGQQPCHRHRQYNNGEKQSRQTPDAFHERTIPPHATSRHIGCRRKKAPKQGVYRQTPIFYRKQSVPFCFSVFRVLHLFHTSVHHFHFIEKSSKNSVTFNPVNKKYLLFAVGFV
jgi:hypothetical protein